MNTSLIQDERGSLLPLILGYLALLTAALTVAVSIGQVATANALLNNMAEEIVLSCASSVDRSTYYSSGELTIDLESARAVARSAVSAERSNLLNGISVDAVVAKAMAKLKSLKFVLCQMSFIFRWETYRRRWTGSLKIALLSLYATMGDAVFKRLYS